MTAPRAVLARLAYVRALLAGRVSETGWLIERDDPGRPFYWGGGFWTLSPDEAIRFARRLDAQRASARLMLGATRIFEHAWSLR